MNYKEKVVNLLEECMTKKGFKLWKGIDKILPDIWDLTTSSTGKYHRKLNGEIPNIAEHVYHMLYASIKIFSLFNIKRNTSEADRILFAVALHDSLKYGTLGTRRYVDNHHDREAADMIASNKETFLKIFSEEQFNVLEESVRFHSGRRSSDIPKDKEFNFEDYAPQTFFVHMLDMMSTYDLIQTDVRE